MTARTIAGFLLLIGLLAAAPARAVEVQGTDPAAASPTVARTPSTKSLYKRTVDLHSAARRGDLDWVRRYADPAVVDTLVKRRHEGLSYDAFRCRKSTASRPGKPITACRFSTNERWPWQKERWWMWYRKAPNGRQIAMKMRSDTPVVFETKHRLAERTSLIISLGWQGRWDQVAKYVKPDYLAALKEDLELSQEESGKEDPPVSRYCYRPLPKEIKGYGSYACEFPSNSTYDDEQVQLGYTKVDGRWLADRATDQTGIDP